MKMSGKNGIALLTLFLVLATSPEGFSGERNGEKDDGSSLPSLTFGGSLRLRYENKKNIKFGAAAKGNDEDFFLTQLRLNVKWQPTRRFSFFVEGQDARIFGEEGIDENKVPNIFADDLDLHQGFVDFQVSDGGMPVKVRIGRQKFNLGALRLVASLEWVNTARVWDGVRVTVGKKKEKTLELISSRLVAVDPDGFNDWAKTGSRLFNSDFHVLYFTDPKFTENMAIEGYWMLRHESNKKDAVHTLGSRFDTNQGDWKFDGEAAGQFGEFGGQDHQAYMAHIGGSYLIEPKNKSRVGAAYNFGSGDSDPTDGTHETFDNQYPLNHAYYGYIDLFSLQNIHNAELTFNTKLGKQFPLRVAYQGFWLADAKNDAWYNAGAGAIRKPTGKKVSSYVGSEVDITIKHRIKKIVFVGGYSHFFTGSYVKATGPSQDVDFLFLLTKIIF